MRNYGVLIAILLGFSMIVKAQKSKVISVFQLIETAKYEDAKKAIDEAIVDEKTKVWPKTWYACGLLCQTSYQKGIAENDKKKYEMYPDQLYYAYNSYEKALELDKKGRLESQLAPMYVLLANDFQKLGEKHFKSKKYEDALKAFEQALKIIRSPILAIQIDTNLVYNTALAAYESKDWNKSIGYLGRLHKDKYSTNVSHLLFTAHLLNGDTLAAEKVLIEGIDSYENNEDLVLLLVDHLYRNNNSEMAVAILDSASVRSPSKYIFPYTKGLVHQKTENYKEAIVAYEKAIILAPEETKIYAQVGTCYYNIGVEIDAGARTISDNSTFREQKAKSADAFGSALIWFEEAYNRDPENLKVITKLYQLYKLQGVFDKANNLEHLID